MHTYVYIYTHIYAHIYYIYKPKSKHIYGCLFSFPLMLYMYSIYIYIHIRKHTHIFTHIYGSALFLPFQSNTLTANVTLPSPFLPHRPSSLEAFESATHMFIPDNGFLSAYLSLAKSESGSRTAEMHACTWLTA